MPTPTRSPATLPPELAGRVHGYLAAFLAPAAADEAFQEVAEDAQFWGGLGPLQVLASTHRALGTRIRIAPEVEVLVLVEDVGLPVDDVAAVLGRQPDGVRTMLDEALAALAEPDEAPVPRAAPPRAGPPGPDRASARVSDEPEHEPVTPTTPAPVPGRDDMRPAAEPPDGLTEADVSSTAAPRRTWVLVVLGLAAIVLVGIVTASSVGGG